MFNVQDLTMGELALVEKKSGQSVTSLGSGQPAMALMMWLGFVIKRREDPTFTEKQAGEMTLAQLNALLGVGEPDPTNEQPPTGSLLSSS